jgi:osmotically-inducible protein OsmY
MRKPDIGAVADIARQAGTVASVPVRLVRRNAGVARGLGYRLLRRHPDEHVDDRTLADRIRSTLGPLEKRLDIPHVHVMVTDHVATLHGDVGSESDVERIKAAVAKVAGVRQVDSKLHVGLIKGDSRPSENRRTTGK